MCDRIPDLDLADALDPCDDVTDLPGAESFPPVQLEPVNPQFLDQVFALTVHETDRIAGVQRPFHNAALKDHAAVPVELGIEDQDLQRRLGIALRAGQLLDDSGQDVADAFAGLCRDRNRLEGVQPQIGVDLLPDPLHVG